MKYPLIMMLVLCFASVTATSFTDNFHNSNFTTEGWAGYCFNGLIDSNIYESDDFDVDGAVQFLGGCGNGPTLWQNFSSEGITYDRDFSIDLRFKKGYPALLPPKDMRLVFSDNDPWTNTGYIFVGLAVEGTGETDINIACGGTCSCSATSVADNNYDGRRYNGTIIYDKATGILNYSRDDGLSVETVISGCDFSQYNTILWARQGEVQGNDLSSAVYDFTVESCDPDWQCSNYSVCNTFDIEPCTAVIDANNCDVIFNGSLTNYDVACDHGTTSASRRGDVMYCDPETNLCYTSIDEAMGGTAFATVPGRAGSNPLKAFFAWLSSLFGGGTEWP